MKILLLQLSLLMMLFCCCSQQSSNSTTENGNDSISETKNSNNIKPQMEYKQYATRYWTSDIATTLKGRDSNFDDETWSAQVFERTDSKDETDLKIELRIREESAYDFRRQLMYVGISLEDYANGKAEMRNIGGIDFAVDQSSSNSTKNARYFARIEGLQFSVCLEMRGKINNEEATTFIEKLAFNFPSGVKKDAPYPWEGAALVTKTGTTKVGKYTFSAKQIKADKLFTPNDVFSNCVEVFGDDIYILGYNAFYIYRQVGDAMQLQQNIDLKNRYSSICRDNEGHIYLSTSNSESYIFDKGQNIGTIKDLKSNVMFNRNADFGIIFDSQLDNLKQINGTSSSAEIKPYKISGSDQMYFSYIYVSDKNVYMAGFSQNDQKIRIYVYDYQGNYQKTLWNADGDGDGLGAITSMLETDKYILALDGNFRSIMMWDKSGKWIGRACDTDLFGTSGSTSWLGGLCKDEKGQMYVSVVDRRPDQSWDELILFKVNIK